METKARTFPFEQLFMGENVRLPGHLKLETLQADIIANGLQNPIQVWRPNGGDKYEVLRGHRRVTAIGNIMKFFREVYDKHFSKGIPCILVSDIDANEALELKVDHGNECPLTDPFELQLCANLLFSAGKTEEAVILSLAGLMDTISPMKVSRRKELDDIIKLSEEAEAKGEKLMATAKREEADKLIADYRRGMVQGLHNAYRCPAIVMAALAARSGGKVPTEFAAEILPDLTANDVKGLWKAHSQDMTILENGRPKFNQARPGPAFRTLWEKLVIKSKEVKPDTVRAKAMSATDIIKDVKEGKFKSEIACRLAAYHAGDKDVVNVLTDLDAKSYAGDLVSQYNPTLWKQVMDEAAAQEKRLIEMDKATTAVKA